jgi:hypothetical protein
MKYRYAQLLVLLFERTYRENDLDISIHISELNPINLLRPIRLSSLA